MFPETGYGPTWPDEYRAELTAQNERSVPETARITILTSVGFLAGMLGALAGWELLAQAPVVRAVPAVGAVLAIAAGLGLGVAVPALLDALGRTARSAGGPAARRIGTEVLDRVRRRPPRSPRPGGERTVEPPSTGPTLGRTIRSIVTHRPRRR